MKLDFDLAGQAAGSGYQADRPFDWHDLRARFAAGYAARAVLGPGVRAAAPIDGGSFDCGSARTLAHYAQRHDDGLADINRTASGDGNSAWDKEAGVTSSVADD